MFNRLRFNIICGKIKDIKIQGATNVAKTALKAYSLVPTKEAKAKLLSLRPTEPMLSHVLNLAEKKIPKEKILAHFSKTQDKINELVLKIIRNDSIIFTHCHSTNVVGALIYAKKHGRHFEVYNTETRPLFQGRVTAKELTKAGIRVTQFVDSAAEIALKKCSYVFLGADAILKNSIINKVGSGMMSEIAYSNKVPVYIIADSWKHSAKNVKIEERDFAEVWGTKEVHVKNPAFESINPRHIRAIVSEFGIMTYPNFLKKVAKR